MPATALRMRLGVAMGQAACAACACAPTPPLSHPTHLINDLPLQRPVQRPGELANINVRYSSVRAIGYRFPVSNPVRVRMLTTVNDALLSEYESAEDVDGGPAPRYVPSLADVNRLYHGRMSRGIVFRASVALTAEILEEQDDGRGRERGGRGHGRKSAKARQTDGEAAS